MSDKPTEGQENEEPVVVEGAAGEADNRPAEPGSGEASGERAGAQEERAAPPKPDWREARIAQLTARLRESQAALNEARAQAPRQEATGGEAAGSVPAAEVERLAQARAQEIAAATSFNEKCNAVFQEGVAAHEDFQARVNQIRQLINPADAQEAANYSAFLSTAIETGEAVKILHTLGGDPGEAQRILALPPARQALELAKLTLSAEAPLSGAPKPIRPVAGGRAAPHTAIDPDDPERADNLSSQEWFRRREAQVKANGARR